MTIVSPSTGSEETTQIGGYDWLFGGGIEPDKRRDNGAGYETRNGKRVPR
jgi:hypothetical protein